MACLAQNRVLEYLDLSFNNITFRGLNSLIEEVKKGNTGHTKVRLHGNPCATNKTSRKTARGLCFGRRMARTTRVLF